MNYFSSWDWTRDWMNSQNQWYPEVDYYYKPPIIAKGQKEIPERLRDHHQWQQAVDVNQLTKYQLKVRMCCAKCAEIVEEEIWEVRGVFDVRAEQWENKVVVVAMPSGLDDHAVLMKARKIDKKAKFVDLDANEKPPKPPKKPDGDKDKTTDNKGGTNTKPQPAISKVVNWASPPVLWTLPRYLYPPSQIQLYPNPYLHLVQFV